MTEISFSAKISSGDLLIFVVHSVFMHLSILPGVVCSWISYFMFVFAKFTGYFKVCLNLLVIFLSGGFQVIFFLITSSFLISNLYFSFWYYLNCQMKV